MMLKNTNHTMRMNMQTKKNNLICVWRDVYCRIERVQRDEQGREIMYDTCCAYCGGS
jgi:hypothetical protein